MVQMPGESFYFDNVRVDSGKRQVWRGEESVKLTGKEFDTLMVLIKQPQTALDKDHIASRVWPGTNIKADDNVKKHISALRKKLGPDRHGCPYILSIKNEGYFLAADVMSNTDDARTQSAKIEPEIQEPAAAPAILARPSSLRRRSLVRWVPGIGMAVIAAIALLLSGKPQRIPGPRPYAGRLLARSTSEGIRPMVIALSHDVLSLAVASGGDRLFAVGSRGRTLSIVNTADGRVTTVSLPDDSGPLAVSPNGKLYIGSLVDGVMVVDIASQRPLPNRIITGGPVFDMAITPDGAKLFLAMGTSGLKRLSSGTKQVSPVSGQVCPEDLTMDSQGKRLYVAYQCAGPLGRRGHDSVEIFDVETEASLGIVHDLPMVGGHPAVSPDGTRVLLDGSDACWNSAYDHVGCRIIPSHELHLLRTSNLQRLSIFSLPAWTAPDGATGSTRFLDNSRFVVPGPSVRVFDSDRNSVLEMLRLGTDAPVAIAFAPDNSRAYLGYGTSICVLELENASCSAPQPGLAMSYPLDGSLGDGAGVTEPEGRGEIQFVPGKVGQAVLLDGSGFLSVPWTGHFQFGYHNSSIALYAKPSNVDQEMVLVDWSAQNPQRGIRLVRSADNRFVFESATEGRILKSQTTVKGDTWYHIAVTQSDREMILYINGQSEDRAPSLGRFDQAVGRPLLIGARSPGQPSFRGKLDEIAFYYRALAPTEVRALYLMRESAQCKP